MLRRPAHQYRHAVHLLGDNIARGYITVDTVNSCTLLFPGDTGYFATGGTGIATNQNVLWGDRVHNGRFVLDQPTDLPEGTEIDLLPVDPGDWLDPDNRAALHRALAASQEDLEGGRLTDAEDVLRDLRTS